ncbi:hypothetical protein LTR70_000205 [Exophiala xenobiotica]|uniref:Uncharacterized protein n=1 Tax=Lithohypha guttulata TaxID=1690604 RepID=A0ABR0KPD4_9EURO|nr:hypothetical protein LTR24_000330 [Lithohypha guttulata]KAK5330883.1 hypothetical protein LTR70_000205 [Exophiala xenobiotica]
MDPYIDCPNHPADEMVYTKARLEHALRVFRETSSYLRTKGFPSEHLERHLRSKYAFRKSSKFATLANVTLWQEKSNGSDDEEYDPEKEKKRLNPKRKKKAEQKRKPDDSGDQDRAVKRSKGEEEEDGAYISFRLTSDKGRALLRDLSLVHKTDLASFEKGRSEEVEPSFWKRYSSSNGSTSTRRLSKPDMLLDDDLSEMDTDGDFESDPRVLTTSLRSGRVRERTGGRKEFKANTNHVAKQEDHVTKVSKASRCHINGVHNKEPSKFDGSTTGRSIRPIDSISDQIELDNDFSSENEQATSVFHPSNSKRNVNRHKAASVKHEPLAPTVTLNEDFSFTYTQSLLDQPGLVTIETAYAHPIDFRFMPPVGQRCDFCSDWRMGILGHGKKVIQVFIDPEHPTQFQEMGNGHRSSGKQCTKMCISCALDRLLIVRCHCMDQANYSSESALPRDSQSAPAFSHLAGAIFNEHNLALYAKRLLPKPGTPEASAPPTKYGPLTPCSLCPQPALWQCSKWQKADKMKKPCRIPEPATPATTVVTSLSSIPLTPPATPATSTSIGLPNGHKKTPSIITISDSDDDSPPPPSPSTNPNLNPNPRPTTTPGSSSQRAPSTTTLSSTTTTSSSSSPSHQTQLLRPPLRGCGLKLCTACKTFVERRCGGFLDKKRVLKWLRDESKVKTGRADVEWLFAGSCLERSYEEGVR